MVAWALPLLNILFKHSPVIQYAWILGVKLIMTLKHTLTQPFQLPDNANRL